MNTKTRLAIFYFLVVLSAAQFACSLPITQLSSVTPTGLVPTSIPSTAAAQEPTPLPATPGAATLAAVEMPASRLTQDMLKNFTYWVPDFELEAALEDGVFSSGEIQVQMIEPAAFGDLNGDGLPDAAVILTLNSGGSGTFYNLFALLDQDATPVQAGITTIGDRQGIRNLEIVDGRIVLDFLTQPLNGPLCCPSEHRLRSYLLEDDTLLLASEQVLDSLEAQATALPNAILIDQPLTADLVTDPLQVRGRLSQVPPGQKLSYYVTDINANLLTQGEVSVDGAPGGPGTFAFEFSLPDVSWTLIQLELVDADGEDLRGRSIVVLVAQE